MITTLTAGGRPQRSRSWFPPSETQALLLWFAPSGRSASAVNRDGHVSAAVSATSLLALSSSSSRMRRIPASLRENRRMSAKWCCCTVSYCGSGVFPSVAGAAPYGGREVIAARHSRRSRKPRSRTGFWATRRRVPTGAVQTAVRGLARCRRWRPGPRIPAGSGQLPPRRAAPRPAAVPDLLPS